MSKVTNLAEYRKARQQARLPKLNTPDPVVTGQFTRDWLDHFADIRHELDELVQDVERMLEDKKPQR